MLATLSIWSLATAFAGAGLFNAIGSPATQASFVRWGYPSWWCRLTGAIEIAIALAIAVPATRTLGLLFGAAVIAAAILTILRHREWSHLAPLGVFVMLLLVTVVAG